MGTSHFLLTSSQEEQQDQDHQQHQHQQHSAGLKPALKNKLPAEAVQAVRLNLGSASKEALGTALHHR